MDQKSAIKLDKKINILPYHVEKDMDLEEKRKYHQRLREYVRTRKLTNTTVGARFLGPRLNKATKKISSKLVKTFTNNNVDWSSKGQENIPEGPCIFAHTHQGILDGFIWIPEIDRHCIILHALIGRKLLILCQMNTGLVLVKKGNSKNCRNGKLDMIRLLLEGFSIAYFPESAWNLSPNKIHLPLSFGFLDVALKAQVPVVPVVHEYTYDTSTEKENITKIRSVYGKPIYVSESDSLEEKLEEYSEAVSTMRYELFVEDGIYKRRDILNRDYINFVKGNYRNLKLGKIDPVVERENIFGAKDDFYLFHHINEVPISELD